MHAQGQSVSYQDALAIVTGIVGIAAGKVSNKGLLIAYMILGVICAIVFAIAVPAFGLVASTCEAGTALINMLCQNAAGEPYCCSACEQNTCGGAGCMWRGSYTTASCVIPPGETLSADVPEPCDYFCCQHLAMNGHPSVYWKFETIKAGCETGFDGKVPNPAHGQGDCETESHVTLRDQCTFDPFSKEYTNYDMDYGISGVTYANTGCHIDNMDTGICDYTLFIWITILVTLGLSIAGSVMGCCVVCCKNDQLGDDDDSG